MPFKGIIAVGLIAFAIAVVCREDLGEILSRWFDEENEYRVVGSAEANPAKGLISDESPVGKALLGRKAGDEVTVEAPAGEIKLKIISISR